VDDCTSYWQNGPVNGKLALVILVSIAHTIAGEQAQPLPANTPTASKSRTDLAADINPDALWDGRKIVPFRALDFPKMVPASEADFLNEDDYVLGATVHGESRAYPTRFVWWHHVINDRIGKSSAGGETLTAITYCSVCNTGIRYDLEVNGHPVKLDFYGLYNGVVALCERETASVLLQVDGRFVSGPLLGSKLSPAPLLDTTWGVWKKLHPDTLVMSPNSPDSKFYSPKDKPEPRGYDRFPAPFFRPSMTRTDKRLPFFEKVLGVSVSASNEQSQAANTVLRRAYPMKSLQEAGGVVNDVLGGVSICVFLEPQSMTAVALARRIERKTLAFEAHKDPDGHTSIVDKETGTRWNIEGRGEEGVLKGKSLQPVECHLSQWYGWAAYFPDTTIYGRSDPPQPVDMTGPDAVPEKPTAPK
jgi:hypothetical protein